VSACRACPVARADFRPSEKGHGAIKATRLKAFAERLRGPLIIQRARLDAEENAHSGAEIYFPDLQVEVAEKFHMILAQYPPSAFSAFLAAEGRDMPAPRRPSTAMPTARPPPPRRKVTRAVKAAMGRPLPGPRKSVTAAPA
jgi:hypothetical protein